MKQDFQFRIRFPLKYCSISLTSKSTHLLILQGRGEGGPHCNSCSFEKRAWTLTLKGWPTDFPLGSERHSPLKYFHSEGWSGRQKKERASGRKSGRKPDQNSACLSLICIQQSITISSLLSSLMLSLEFTFTHTSWKSAKCAHSQQSVMPS